MDKSKPVLRFLTPTSRNTAAFRQPTEGSLDNPASGGEARFTRNGTVLLRLIAPMLDVGDVILQTHKGGVPGSQGGHGYFMDGKIKSILNIVVVIVVILWLLSVFGVIGSLSGLRVGK